MGKKVFSLCMALALCLGLLPATARAITPRIAYDILWIGNTLITDSGYWTTDGNGNLMASDAGNYNIAFDADTNTLTLNNANIAGQYDFTYNNVGAGIWAYSRSGAVSLNIQVTGNNVVSGSVGVYALSNGGEVSVTISGGGSLTASGSLDGIGIMSEFSSAALAIENTAVKASGAYGDGVRVQAGESSTGSLSVDGGSLTASGNTGIEFLFSTGMSGSGTPSLTVAGNAVVDAKGGGIAHNSSNNLSIQGNSGIVFNGSTGTVYGNASLQKDLTIGEGESLTLDHGASLNANGHNVIVDGGTLDSALATSLGGSVIYKVTKVELNKTSLTLQQTGSDTLTVTVEPDNATNKNVNWESSDTSIATVDASGKVTAISAGSATITVAAADGSGVSASCSVTVTHGNMVHIPKKDATCTTEGNKEYWTCGTCGKIFSDAEGKTEIELSATVIPATGHNLTKTEEKAPTCTAEGNTEYWTCETCGKHFSDEEGKTEIELSATVIPAVGHRFSGGTCTVCGAPDPNYTPPYIPPTYAVTVPETTGGTVTVSPSRASSGRRVTITAAPDTGFALESLTVLDSRDNEIPLTDKGDGKYTFTMPASRVTVEASFTPAPLPFEDVAPGAWYESAVRYAYFHNIMEGMRETEFSPTTALTRAMAAQILYNLEGQPDISSENLGYPYEDVDAQAWHGDAVYWARITGVATGYGDGTFQPGDSITRQEFAQMLYNYAKYKGYDLCVEGDLAQFPDSESVADWAEAAMRWANGNGLINGHDDGTIDAAGIGTRAQAASILMKFDQNLVEN